jgi:RNA polymerase sigma-B factor
VRTSSNSVSTTVITSTTVIASASASAVATVGSPSDGAHRASSARTPGEERRRAETLALYTLSEADPPADREAARRSLVARVVEQHLDVADSVARRYASSGVERDDLRQVARLGLVKAALRFDHSVGEDFVAFAAPTVAGEVKRHLRDATWFVRPPRRLQELCSAALTTRASLAQSLGRMPEVAEIAAELREPEGEVAEALRARADRLAGSLDVVVDPGSGVTVGATIAADDPWPLTEARCELDRAIATLPERDRVIVRLRFVDELSQAEIGRVLGVTQMQVSRLLTKVLARLRDQLDDAPAPGPTPPPVAVISSRRAATASRPAARRPLSA